MLTVDELVALVPPGEEVRAVGMAEACPVVVTSSRLIRASSGTGVSLPFAAIESCDTWRDKHRMGVRLFHAPINPQRPPGEAKQWWRWHDRRKFRRLWTETELTFSSTDTRAARALRDALTNHDVTIREVPSPVEPQPQASAQLRSHR
jgi:hypothetical protein